MEGERVRAVCGSCFDLRPRGVTFSSRFMRPLHAESPADQTFMRAAVEPVLRGRRPFVILYGRGDRVELRGEPNLSRRVGPRAVPEMAPPTQRAHSADVAPPPCDRPPSGGLPSRSWRVTSQRAQHVGGVEVRGRR